MTVTSQPIKPVPKHVKSKTSVASGSVAVTVSVRFASTSSSSLNSKLSIDVNIGVSFKFVTVIDIVTVSELNSPSLALYVKLSSPTKSASGSYCHEELFRSFVRVPSVGADISS